MKRPVPLRFCSCWGRDSYWGRDHRSRLCEPLAASQARDSRWRRDRRSRLYCFAASPFGYTLIEILVATTLSLLLLGAVVKMFGDVGQGITDSRAMLESADRLRVVQARLQQDLAGVTVTMSPPRKPENNEGYFEYIEGPVGTSLPMTLPSAVAVNTDMSAATPDTTVGDFDDILMFTTRSTGRPFVGRSGTTTIQSDVAEVAWFVRGRTLHRRVLLVVPSVLQQLDSNHDGVLSASELTLSSTAAFFGNYDISARVQGTGIVPNTLGDLTRRECRFAHAGPFPYSVAGNWFWTWVSSTSTTTFPTLPTLNECSFSSGWAVDRTGGSAIKTFDQTAASPIPLDFWSNVSNYRVADNAITGADGTRVADDVILTNVIGFDVKAWDPTANGGIGAYVDLGYDQSLGTPTHFNGLGVSTLAAATNNDPRIYDTYSTSYEGANASDGFDDPPGNGIVDDDAEKQSTPPYPIPLRGIQVKIRVFEPDSRQIREVTVVQDFLPQ